jgi:ATP-dependent Zn protease
MTRNADKMLRLLQTCYHEAAHAVIGLELNIPFEEISILTKNYGAGWVSYPYIESDEFDDMTFAQQKKVMRKFILVNYAGYYSEKKYFPVVDKSLSYGDIHEAFEVSIVWEIIPKTYEKLGDSIHKAYLKKLEKKAEKLVTKHWQKIELVAKKLAVKKHLTCKQVQQLIKKNAL